jgi:hypothetical protein
LKPLNKETAMANGIEGTDWSPNRKIVAQAAAVLVLWIVQVFVPDLEIPIGIEGSLVVLIGYAIPNKTRSETLVERVEETRVVDIEHDA